MRVDHIALYRALQHLNRIADPKACHPALRYVKLVATGGILKASTLDFDQSLTIELPCEGELLIWLPCKLMMDVITPKSKEDMGMLSIENIGERAVIVQSSDITTELVATKLADFSTDSTKDWNAVTTWNANEVRKSLGYVLPAVSKDPSRPNICGVLFEACANIVATDGHRCHISPLPLPLPDSFLLPTASATTLHRLLKEGDLITLARTEYYLKATISTWTFETRLLDKEFPDYRQVTSQRYSQLFSIRLDAKVFRKALAYVRKLTTKNYITIVINDTVTLVTSDIEMGDAEVILPTIENNHQGEDVVMGFNPVYLLDAIARGAKSIELCFSNTDCPLLINSGAEQVAFVMPKRP